MWKWIIGLLVVVALAGGGYYYYQNVYLPQRTAADTPQFETVTIARGDIAATVNGTGSIEPEAQVALSFRNPGRVQDVLVSEGQAVQKGQLLAELDTRERASGERVSSVDAGDSALVQNVERRDLLIDVNVARQVLRGELVPHNGHLLVVVHKGTTDQRGDLGRKVAELDLLRYPELAALVAFCGRLPALCSF